MKTLCLKRQPKYYVLCFESPYFLLVTAAKCVKFMNGLDLILLIATFSSEFRSTTVYFEVAEIEVRVKQEAVKGVLDPEGQKPT
jgi:uncharacterized membrane protein